MKYGEISKEGLHNFRVESIGGGKYAIFATNKYGTRFSVSQAYTKIKAEEELIKIRRNPMASSIRIPIPEKVLAWRERLRKGSIMKPRTFSTIKRKGAARYKKRGVGKKVAGKAYQVTLLRRYLDAHPGDKYVEGILRRLSARRYKKNNPKTRIRWYIGMAQKGGAYRVFFKSSSKPTKRRYPDYEQVVGPFLNEEKARQWWRDYLLREHGYRKEQ